MSAVTAARAEKLTIGKLSHLTGVNIETIRYYEKVKVLPVPSRAERKRASRVRPNGSAHPCFSCGARASWDFRSRRCAPCCGSAVLKKPRVVKSGRSLPTTSMISAQRSPISASWNTC
jgi:MerR family regulatory protein